MASLLRPRQLCGAPQRSAAAVRLRKLALPFKLIRTRSIAIPPPVKPTAAAAAAIDAPTAPANCAAPQLFLLHRHLPRNASSEDGGCSTAISSPEQLHRLHDDLKTMEKVAKSAAWFSAIEAADGEHVLLLTDCAKLGRKYGLTVMPVDAANFTVELPGGRNTVVPLAEVAAVVAAQRAEEKMKKMKKKMMKNEDDSGSESEDDEVASAGGAAAVAVMSDEEAEEKAAKKRRKEEERAAKVLAKAEKAKRKAAEVTSGGNKEKMVDEESEDDSGSEESGDEGNKVKAKRTKEEKNKEKEEKKREKKVLAKAVVKAMDGLSNDGEEAGSGSGSESEGEETKEGMKGAVGAAPQTGSEEKKKPKTAEVKMGGKMEAGGSDSEDEDEGSSSESESEGSESEGEEKKVAGSMTAVAEPQAAVCLQAGGSSDEEESSGSESESSGSESEGEDGEAGVAMPKA